MSTEREDRNDGWPAWLEPLRPDRMARARMKRSILTAAAPLLAGRHPAGWWEVAADWSSVAIPIAASIALLFGWIAYESSPPPVPTPESEQLEIEALMQPAAAAALPALLIDQSEPSSDALLAATLRREER
ncbi:MAG: hypothetical protein Q8W51_08040 [Candidatus Palauibacterales bacterium]|nr:hypothetical protein [Candidatus Palauibacterales bacterium]MDP2529673.1 hypothetical protein [Candidatus Palauibacterales bacterium]MDP2584089.1 hypothetical protein [Candidatus Palauibacterales bacterium]